MIFRKLWKCRLRSKKNNETEGKRLFASGITQKLIIVNKII